MLNETVAMIVNIGTACFVALLAFVMNGMRDQMNRLESSFRLLNDAVLGKYVTKEEFNKYMGECDRKWEELEKTTLHKIRGKLQEHETEIEVIQAVTPAAQARARRRSDRTEKS